MRLWHYKLIPFLPKSQLLAQWRELNCIFKENNPKHILINYIYEYPKSELWNYSRLVIEEMNKRGYKVDYFNFDKYFTESISHFTCNPFSNHHNKRYLQQCFYNLQEKFDRGQKDFSQEEYDLLKVFFYLNYYGT